MAVSFRVVPVAVFDEDGANDPAVACSSTLIPPPLRVRSVQSWVLDDVRESRELLAILGRSYDPFRLSRVVLDDLVAEGARPPPGREGVAQLRGGVMELVACLERKRLEEGPLRHVRAYYMWVHEPRPEPVAHQPELAMGTFCVVSTFIHRDVELDTVLDQLVVRVGNLMDLQAAARGGDVRALEGLVAEGADVSVTSAQGATLVHVAAAGGSVEMIRYLVSELGMSPTVGDRGGVTPLEYALANGSVDAVKCLVQLAGDAFGSMVREHGARLILLAAQGGSVDAIDLVMSWGVGPEAVDSELVAPIHAAALYGRVDAVKHLMELGLDVQAVDADNHTALMLACAAKVDVEVVRVLLEAGSDVQAVSVHNHTALMLACAAKADIDVVRALLEAGSDAQTVDVHNHTALMLACAANADIELVRMLLGAGSDARAVDANNHTALMLTCANNAGIEVVRVLLEAGSDVHAAGMFNHTALTLACTNNGDIEVVRALLEAGSDATAQGVHNRTALMLACTNNASIEVVRMLLEAGSDVRAVDTNNHTALMLACANSASIEVVHALLEAGSDVHAAGMFNHTALTLACTNSASIEVVRALLEAGSSVTAPDVHENTALLLACANNASIEVVRVLLEAGSDVHAVDMYNHTALHLACANDAGVEVVSALLEAGLDVCAVDARDHTALHLACANNAGIKVVRALLDAGSDVGVVDAESIRTMLAFALHQPRSCGSIQALLERGSDLTAADTPDSSAHPRTQEQVRKEAQAVCKRLYRLETVIGSSRDEAKSALMYDLHKLLAQLRSSGAAAPSVLELSQAVRRLEYAKSVVAMLREPPSSLDAREAQSGQASPAQDQGDERPPDPDLAFSFVGTDGHTERAHPHGGSPLVGRPLRMQRYLDLHLLLEAVCGHPHAHDSSRWSWTKNATIDGDVPP